MKELLKYGFLLLILLTSTFSFSQNSKIDSLLVLIKKDKPDSNKVNHLNLLGKTLMYNKPDTSIILIKQALRISKKLKWKSGIASSMGNLGVCYTLKADYKNALDNYLNSLDILIGLRNLSHIAARYCNIGVVYWYQGNYPKALEYTYKALRIDEKLRDKNGIAADLGNIGLIYADQKEYNQAKEYYFKALTTAKELNDKGNIAIWTSNIGLIYTELAKEAELKGNTTEGDNLYKISLSNYFSALNIARELGDKKLIATNLGNIGNVYSRQDNEDEALKYYVQALEISKQISNKQLEANNVGNIGSIYTKLKKFKLAEQYLLKGITLETEIGSLDVVRRFEESLSNLYALSNRFDLALIHYKKAMTIKDSLFNEEKNKQMTRQEMNYEFEKKESATKAIQDKKDAVAKEELKRKEQQRNYFIVGFALVLMLALFILRGFRQKQKANILISKQKLEVEHKNEIIEEKQKEILDSIRYAKRIQMALLPSKKYIQKSIARLTS